LTRVRRLALALAAVVLLSAGCVGRSASTGPAIVVDPTAPRVELMVLGAASLKGALDAVARAYAPVGESVSLTISTDSSSALETKIEQGAPADVFLSADTTNPQKLIDGGFAAGSTVLFAGNRLAIIVPGDNPAGLTSPKDLAEPGVDIIAAGDEVPITTYASQLVDRLAALPGYPATFAADYAANVASKEESVKAVVGKIELGQGDAGIVYATDAVASANVARVEVPDDANVPAAYGGIVVKASTHATEAQAFLAWLAGPGGQAVLASFGFQAPPA
jgi:molybdate transport system substrate-binding protein